jgi:chromatin structure-remodeling complex protein RSC7
MRKATMGGVYDIHTNTMQYPQITQPTHCRWERVPPADLHKDMSALNLTTDSDTTDSAQNKGSYVELIPQGDTSTEKPSTIFPPVPAHIANNYLVQDIVYESPPYSNMGIPGPDGDLRNLQPNGIVSTANPTHPEFMTPEIIALLPPECKEALIEAAAREVEWKSKWSTEANDGARAQPTKSFAWYP